MTAGPQRESLFDALTEPETTNVRRSDPDTSKAAARKLRPGTDMVEVLLAFDTGPMTDALLAVVLGWGQERARKRRSDLKRYGYLADTGLRRESSSGREMIVWGYTVAGRAAADELSEGER